MKILINEEQLINLSENVQLANKIYFNTGKLTPDDKNMILNITRGDQTTKLISDIYYQHKEAWRFGGVKDDLRTIHQDLLDYNKNVFPIKEFNLYNPSGVNYYDTLMNRHKIIEDMKVLPSVALRNLRSDIRTERNSYDMKEYASDLHYFLANISMLNNRDEKTRDKIMQKVYKSNTTLRDMLRFVDDKENLIGGVDMTREKIEEIIRENDYDLILKYDENNVMVIQVESASAIKEIGCNSLWCFTYGEDNYQTWYNYSQYGMVYIIVNLNEPSDSSEFMWVLIKPLEDTYDYDNGESPLFNMSNDNYYDPYSVLNQLIGDDDLIRELFNFDVEDEEEDFDDDVKEKCEDQKEFLVNIMKKYFDGSFELDNENVRIKINSRGKIDCENGTINITHLNKKTGKENTGNIKVENLPTYVTNLQLFERKLK